jgi:hypothetical protein
MDQAMTTSGAIVGGSTLEALGVGVAIEFLEKGVG